MPLMFTLSSVEPMIFKHLTYIQQVMCDPILALCYFYYSFISYEMIDSDKIVVKKYFKIYAKFAYINHHLIPIKTR